MAKTKKATVVVDLSRKVQNAINAIRKPVSDYLNGLAAINIKRDEIAPQLMKAFGMWQAETGGTFVDFCRFLLPDAIPAGREYRTNSSFMALDYMRRMVAGTTARPVDQRKRGGPQAASPKYAIARVVSSLLRIIPKDQHDSIFTAFKTELAWREDRITELRQLAESTDPLVQIRARIQNLRLAFPHVEGQGRATEEGEGLRRAG